jgi:trehalose-phosphatase
MRPPPTKVPQPLPPNLMAAVAGRGGRIFLFLDYDGTISEITPAFTEAYPVSGARELIARLADCANRCTVALISGRDIDRLTALVGLTQGLLFVGSHGMEVMEPGGQRWLAEGAVEGAAALERVRQWLRENLPTAHGFHVEDKKLSIALHYRQANPDEARRLTERFSRYVGEVDGGLRVTEGKMVVEVLPATASKGYAVRFLVQNASGQPLPIYFGDDVTDEDAFYALREDGLTIRVGEELRPSWARFQVQNPTQVVTALGCLAESLAPTCT